MSVLLAAAVVALNLVVWGAHALLPWRFAGAAAGGEAQSAARRVWSIAALPTLGLAVIATLIALRVAPDAALAWRMASFSDGAVPARLVVVACAALGLADAVALVGGRGFGVREWRVLATLGVVALALQTLASELVRIGWGPIPQQSALLAAAALRLPLAFAAGEIAAGPPRAWTTAAGPALFAAVALWPGALRAALAVDHLTLWGACLLLALARFLPVSMRRPAAVTGVLLAALFLARAGQVGAILGGGETVPDSLLEP